jgi:hypothetical protein
VNQETVHIVSGLPRSGTSMMMRMLETGGLPVLIDEIREPDPDNPQGYYEFERVKQIETDQAWLPDAQGKVVKMIGALLKHLPPEYEYKVIWMQRDLHEMLASQRRMLIRRGEPTDTVSDEQMAAFFRRHVKQVKDWLASQSNIDTLYVSYNEILGRPADHARLINEFLGGSLAEEDMVAVVDRALYRQRSQHQEE